jgi:predicted Zn-dependent peptidase
MSATVPGLTTPRKPAKLRSTETVLDNGLTVVAVRKPGVPLVEVRLRVPFLSAKPAHPAQGSLLAESILTGADGYDRAGLAAAVQALGGELTASADSDRLVLVGNALATNLRKLLGVLANVVTGATYAADETNTERGRLVERLTIARARPSVAANEALSARLWGEHPYGRDLAQPEDVEAVTAAQLRALHRAMVRPGRAVLVLVGDVPPSRMIDIAAAAFADWTGSPARTKIAPLPAPQPGGWLLVDRPGSVQSTLRMARPAVNRIDAAYPAAHLANLIFGGYFTSRWTQNLREDKGYTYGPHSRIEHRLLGSLLVLSVEVQTEVTAPSVLETLYELGRLATLPPTEAELDSARQYAIGTLALSTATQAGLASTLSGLAGFGLGLEWLAELPRQLQAVTIDEVAAAAERFLAPASFTNVVVGDAATIKAPLTALVSVED